MRCIKKICVSLIVLTMIFTQIQSVYANEENQSGYVINKTKTTDNGISVSIKTDEDAFGYGTDFKVKTIHKNEVLSKVSSLYSNKNVVDIIAVDITFYDSNGNEVQPKDNKKVHVTINNSHKINGSSYDAFHIKDNKQVEKVSYANISNGKKASFNATSFSIYGIVGTINDDLKIRTYEFYNDKNQLISSQKIKKGDTLLKPSIPTYSDTKTFVKWEKANGEEFNDFGIIKDTIENDGEVIKVYAKYENILYVHYYDQYGAVIKSDKVVSNSEIDIIDNYPILQIKTLTQSHVGWSLTKDGSSSVGNKLKINDSSINLYPIIKEGYWITFESNGGTSISR